MTFRTAAHSVTGLDIACQPCCALPGYAPAVICGMRSRSVGGCAWLADSTVWTCCTPFVNCDHALIHAAMTAGDGLLSDQMRETQTVIVRSGRTAQHRDNCGWPALCHGCAVRVRTARYGVHLSKKLLRRRHADLSWGCPDTLFCCCRVMVLFR